MAHVNRVQIVAVAPEVAVAYLRDFSHAVEWDPGTVSCTRTSTGAIGLGSTWRNVSKFLGRETELEYELTVDEPDRLVFTGKNRTATSVDDIRLTPEGLGARLEYDATVTLNGLARLTDPVVQLAFNRIADPTVQQLAETLERLGTRTES